MVVVTMMVAKAMLVTLAAFRTRFKNPDTTPYLARPTVLITELELGE